MGSVHVEDEYDTEVTEPEALKTHCIKNIKINLYIIHMHVLHSRARQVILIGEYNV